MSSSSLLSPVRLGAVQPGFPTMVHVQPPVVALKRVDRPFGRLASASSIGCNLERPGDAVNSYMRILHADTPSYDGSSWGRRHRLPATPARPCRVHAVDQMKD